MGGLLGTITSRNADYRGYWFVGQLLSGREHWRADLLGSPPSGSCLFAFATRLAIRRFQEQVDKSPVSMEIVREATLQFAKGASSVDGRQGDFRVSGHLVKAGIRVAMDDGREFEMGTQLFVAPHDATRERRRAPEQWGDIEPPR